MNRRLLLLVLFTLVLAQNDVMCGWSSLTMPNKRAMMLVDVIDDMVIFGGGSSGGSRTDLLETFNTTSMQWNTTRMQFARDLAGHGVSDNWVLYYGGSDFSGNVLGSWEAHNLKNGSILSGTKDPKSYVYSGTVAGKVIVAGGMSDEGIMLDTVDIWDGRTGEWSQSLSPERRGYGDSAVVGDCFYMLSGYDSDWVLSELVFYYNITSDSWGNFALSIGRTQGGVAVSGTKLYYAGGSTESIPAYYPNVDIYDSSTGLISTLPLLVPRFGVYPFLIGNVLGIAGGSTVNDELVAPWEMYNLVSGNNWTVNFGEAKFNIKGATLNGMALVAGGSLTNGESDRMDIYSCIACVPGTSGNQGYIPCSQCPAGKFSGSAASVCSDCPAGSFSGPGASTCQFCQAGKFSNSSSGSCSDCPAGSYSAGNSSKCDECPAGTESDPTATACVQCTPGNFSEIPGTACQKCQNGTTSAAGATKCVRIEIPEKTTSSEKKDPVDPGTIAGAVIGSIALLVIIIFVLIFLVMKKRRKVNTETELDEKKNESRPEYVPIKSEMTVATDAVIARQKENDWEIPFSELVFKEDDLLGSGDFGQVYYGQWRGIPVAIKKFKMDNKQFREEIAIVKNLRPHLNVVQFYGACTKEGTPMCLVAEYLSTGSLVKYMKENTLTKKEIAEVLCGAAAGVNHLHSEGLVHRDIAARNILLSRVGNKLIAKISDFGLSRNVNEAKDDKVETESGPTRWMSPESLKDKSYSTKSDVWSFGVLCWEAVYNKIPFQEHDDFTAGAKVAYEKLRLNVPNENDWPQLHQIMIGCFKEDPRDRFDMAQIVDILKNWENSFNIQDSRELY
eukprot:TRINITY_DN36_c0_g2_i8.p1 TRINITY_DN36_c0_g2~~TRINITY_DN36_c0_g2_i8.p1  ORF type:complete len:852 (-),score=196.69 TRINITY_DN36_c0_g2_i8:116-2638(-)